MSDFIEKYITNCNNPTSFNEVWGLDKNFSNHLDYIDKLQAVCELFYNGLDYKSKGDNTYHNEIRERGLFTIFSGDFIKKEGVRSISHAEDLYDKWKVAIEKCIKQYCESSGIEYVDINFIIEELIIKGGQSYSYDYELIIKDNANKKYTIKIELKYSSSGNNTIKSLAQFNAINTESRGAKVLLGNNNYLDFFWDNNYLQEICTAIDYTIDPSKFTKTAWKKSAKGQKPTVKSHPNTIEFHNKMRAISNTDEVYNKRKNIVSLSYKPFILTLHDHLSKPETKEALTKMFHDSQDDKVYCIFSNKTKDFHIDMIDKTYTITDFKLDNYPGATFDHTFILITDSPTMIYNIQCEMSWGNGGHGNNNPRIKFKLLDKPVSSGGGGGDTETTIDANIELAEGDNTTKTQIEQIKGKTDDVINLSQYMVLKRGKLLNKTVGGKKRARRYTRKQRTLPKCSNQNK